jgi:hypothetical protein
MLLHSPTFRSKSISSGVGSDPVQQSSTNWISDSRIISLLGVALRICFAAILSSFEKKTTPSGITLGIIGPGTLYLMLARAIKGSAQMPKHFLALLHFKRKCLLPMLCRSLHPGSHMWLSGGFHQDLVETLSTACRYPSFSTNSTTFTGTMQVFALTHRPSFTGHNLCHWGLVFI